MEPGFSKADSANLPKVDAFMVAMFYRLNPDFCFAESRNAKTIVSSRHSYGDDAVGYVQLKREAKSCVVKGKICPEHKVRQQQYSVTMVVDEKEGKIISVQCNDCPASQGCCKHAVAFLMWTHRRSEEPSCTATECYWKKSKLSKVGSTLKYMKIKEMNRCNNSDSLQPNDESVLHDFIEESRKRKLENCQLLKHLSDDSDDSVSVVQLLSLHSLSYEYNIVNDCNTFLKKIDPVYTDENISIVEKLTCDQHKSPAWHELRYARITASKAYEVSRCHTSDGALVAMIMGAKVPDTAAMKRGRLLEDHVRKQLEKQLGKISLCGLLISQQHPIIAASPDGILNGDTIIEIKCPVSEKTFKNYVFNNKVGPKFYAQVQLQMNVAKLEKSLFCVASWDFEKNKQITIVPIEYNATYTEELISKLITFWKNNIYQILYVSTK